eukprot:gene17210-biopygen12860
MVRELKKMLWQAAACEKVMQGGKWVTQTRLMQMCGKEGDSGPPCRNAAGMKQQAKQGRCRGCVSYGGGTWWPARVSLGRPRGPRPAGVSVPSLCLAPRFLLLRTAPGSGLPPGSASGALPPDIWFIPILVRYAVALRIHCCRSPWWF